MFDGYVARESFRHYKARLAGVDILAIAAMSPLKALDTELTIRLAKTLNPRVQVVLGGNHASAFPDQWIEKGADFVITGEGEVAFRTLMEVLSSGSRDVSNVPNLVYGRPGEVSATGLRAPAIQLDSSPFPSWEPLDLGLTRSEQASVDTRPQSKSREAVRIAATSAISTLIGGTGSDINQ